MEAWDENDTVSDAGNLWFAARQPTAEPELSDEEQRAATLAWAHRRTPTVTHFDHLGRPFLVQQFLEAFDPLPAADKIVELRSVLDIEGQVLAVVDPLGRTCMTYTYAVDGQVLKQGSIDAGNKWALSNVLGTAFRAWDAVGHRTRVEVDVLQRPTHVWVQKGAGAEWLATRVLHGESFPSPEDDNLRGKVGLVFDGAGVVETSSFDFKGNALTWSRRLAVAVTAEPDWTAVASTGTPATALAAAASLLDNETWEKAFAYDALGRVTSATMPDQSEVRPTYNEASLLEKVEVRIRGASTWTTFVDSIAYDAHGRRTAISYGNNTSTSYFYEEQTFRLTRILTTRSTDSKVLQDLTYTYDPVGNIVEVHDDAHEDVFYNDAQVSPEQEFEYDALYRLVAASGREHSGSVGDDQRDHNDLPLWNLPHPNNAAALRRYNEEYTYDKVGNILEFAHEGVNGPSGATWTRTYRYGTGLTSGYADNRLHSTSVPGPAWASYSHDANGNMTAMPHLASIAYTHRDQMRHADLGGGGDAYYTYDAGGERVRKFIQRIGTTTEERIYLGGWEIYRKRTGIGQDIEVERETLHVMDDARRIAMVETLTVEDEEAVTTPEPRIRYQYGNHLDSAMLECDDVGDVISYEEYHPYGTAAYRSARSGVEVSEKRYRYTGKERDEETGLHYHSARYYAPWLGRWTSADPAGMVDGPGLYGYARNSPIVLHDPRGTDSSPWSPFVRFQQLGRAVQESSFLRFIADHPTLSVVVGAAAPVAAVFAAEVAPAVVTWVYANPGTATSIGAFGVGLADPHPPGTPSPVDLPGPVDDAGRATRAVVRESAKQIVKAVKRKLLPKVTQGAEQVVAQELGPELEKKAGQVVQQGEKALAQDAAQQVEKEGVQQATQQGKQAADMRGTVASPRSGHGRPGPVSVGMAPLNKRQQRLLSALPEKGSSTIVKKSDVGLADLAALTGGTEGHPEFLMLTRRGERVIIRGDAEGFEGVIDVAWAKNMSAEGWRFSGHVHPSGTLRPSQGGLDILDVWVTPNGLQQRSSILSRSGKHVVFERR